MNTSSRIRQQRLVEAWNAEHAVGTPVILTRDNGEELRTKTCSEAELMGGHTAVVWCENVRGCYDLSRVRPAEEAP